MAWNDGHIKRTNTLRGRMRYIHLKHCTM